MENLRFDKEGYFQVLIFLLENISFVFPIGHKNSRKFARIRESVEFNFQFLVLPNVHSRDSIGPFTRAIFVAIFLILTHAIEWFSHKSIDLYSFAQMV